MPRRARTFIAVDLDPFTIDRAAALQARLARDHGGVRWVDRNNFHITLVFLGEVDERELIDVCRAVGEAASAFTPFAVTTAGIGAFPNLRRPRTLIAHVTEGAEQLAALHEAIEAKVMPLGCYRREERAFTPHLTLGRLTRDAEAEWATELRQYAGWQGGRSLIGEVLVMTSRLTAEGPTYTVLSRARFSPPKH